MNAPTKWILGSLSLGAVSLMSSSDTEVTKNKIVEPTPITIPATQEKQVGPKETIIPKIVKPKVVTPKYKPRPKPKPVKKYVEPKCHPGYSGCLNPNASDYDCAGGSGNGPYYTSTVQVYGSDPFGLDRDHDGWGCE